MNCVGLEIKYSVNQPKVRTRLVERAKIKPQAEYVFEAFAEFLHKSGYLHF